MKKDILDKCLDVGLAICVIGLAFSFGVKYGKKRGVL
jgi:hypothetical protein